MPQEKLTESARNLLAAFERLKAEEPLPPYDEEAFTDPRMRGRVGALIARAVEDRPSSGWGR
ncbi:MAG TPA: hypothetical protein VJQ55_18350 [Candidatus Binatia bacterium]|nr:hypothetical protein [Candidatus Binatia bacterium]